MEQWLSTKEHVPALIGVGAAVVCLLIFRANDFLIPTMVVIVMLLGLYKKREGGVSDDE